MAKSKEETLEEMFHALSELFIVHIIGLDQQIAYHDGLRRYVFGGGPKCDDQKRLEKELKDKAALFEVSKDEIAERLNIKNVVAGMKMSDFYDFLLVNFHFEKDEIFRRNEKFLMPCEITVDIRKKAAREVGKKWKNIQKN